MQGSIPKNHPRYESLMLRQLLADGMAKGLVHETGLIAHGRGEAFDYLLGEKSCDVALEAEKVAAAQLLLAERPVTSVNGNVVALVADDCVKLSGCVPAVLEVNLFHRTDERVGLLVDELKAHGAKKVLGLNALERIPGLTHDRGLCERDGIFSSDVVLVPLEDGDRCQALKSMGKFVITIDLNPLSRTARSADITIVDNVCRALRNITKYVEELKDVDVSALKSLVNQWDNKQGLHAVLEFIAKRLNEIDV